jgi:hypothetical protein
MLHGIIRATTVRLLRLHSNYWWLLELHDCSGHRRRFVTKFSNHSSISFLFPTTGLYNACAGQGLTIPILTFPGQDPGRPVSSISGAAAPTSTESQTSSQSVVTSLSAPLSTTAPVSQSTVTSLPSTTALPSVASSSPTTNSARKMEGSVDLHIPLMMIGSLIVASSLVLS